MTNAAGRAQMEDSSTFRESRTNVSGNPWRTALSSRRVTPSPCWIAMLRQLYGAVFLLVLPLYLAVSGTSADEISGTYRHAATLQATLEVRRQTGDYLVRLEGGASAADGAATPADCVIEARGALEGDVLHARFGPVETEIFSYSAAQAEREGRVVEIVF